MVFPKDFCMNGRMAVTVISRSERVFLALVSVCAVAWIAGNNKAITGHLQRGIIQCGLGVSNARGRAATVVVDAGADKFHNIFDFFPVVTSCDEQKRAPLSNNT